MDAAQSARLIPTLTFAAVLGLGMTSAAAQPATPGPATGERPAQSVDRSSSTGEAVSDAWITTKVKGELAMTEDVKSTEISVTTVDGVVTLTGVLESQIAVDKAEAAARSIKGVRNVDISGLKVKS